MFTEFSPFSELQERSLTIKFFPKSPSWGVSIFFSDQPHRPSEKISDEFFDSIFIVAGNTIDKTSADNSSSLLIGLRNNGKELTLYTTNEYLSFGELEICMDRTQRKDLKIIVSHNDKMGKRTATYIPLSGLSNNYFNLHPDINDTSDYSLEYTIEDTIDYSHHLVLENLHTKSPVLDLSQCGMKAFPEEVSELVWLEELIVGIGTYYDYDQEIRVTSGNKGEPSTFSRLPIELPKLKKLKKLVLAGSKSNPLPILDLSGIASLTNLEFLSITNGSVSDISPLAELKKLRQLYLYGNNISDITPLSSLKQLKVLRLRGNNITDIYPLESLTSLRVLRMGRNNITDISSLKYMKQLENLSLYSNNIENITSLKTLLLLKKISLRDNRITDIKALGMSVSLEELDLRTNAIKDLSPLIGNPSLRKLYLKNNNIHSVASLAGILTLEELDFGNNSIDDLSPLMKLRKLQKINFDDTMVSKLRPLASLGALKEFSCKGCKIGDCTADVYETGDAQQIRGYFGIPLVGPAKKAPSTRSKRSADSKTINAGSSEGASTDQKKDVKLIILGNSNAGKSNLVNYLETEIYQGQRKTTHGLEVRRWLPDEKTYPELKDIAVSIWDFGGQEYYHESYRLFLSSNAVYLLLWSADTNINGRRKALLEDNTPEVDLEHFEIRYWLDTIRYYSKASTMTSLLVAQNKIDQPEGKRRLTQELHDQYGIKDSFHISLQEGSKKDNPRQHGLLTNFLSDLEYAIKDAADKVPPPPHWQNIRNRILSMKNSSAQHKDFFSTIDKDALWISLQDFTKGCMAITGLPQNEDQEYTIPRWLDRGGVVVFFPDIELLKDKIFIRPDQLARTIYEVLNKDVLAKGGEFSKNDILPNKKEEHKDVFLGIARHLELIFPHPTKGDGYYIAPQYLPETHAIEDLFKIASKDAWLSAFWVRTPLFYYKKILHGLLIRFASDPNTKSPYFWKHGILFIKNDLRVLIKGLYPSEKEHEGTILISVEKDATRQGKLQKEIFDALFYILGENSRLSLKAQVEFTGTENSSRPDETTQLLDLLEDIKVEVSYDGANFIEYRQLLLNDKEPKIRLADTNTWLSMKNFSSILPFNPIRAKKVFLSYSHQNVAWLKRLRTHLAGLRRSKEIESWDDRELLPGDLWDASIKKNLEEADVFILLLSADFIASEYIWNEELQAAFRHFRSRNAQIIPILFEPLDLGGLPGISPGDATQSISISSFEIAPKTDQGQLLAVSLWDNAEEALAKIAETIRQAIKRHSA